MPERFRPEHWPRFVRFPAFTREWGAHRVCYVVFPEFGTIALVAIFGKTEKADLTKADCRVIARMIESYRAELMLEFGRRQ